MFLRTGMVIITQMTYRPARRFVRHLGLKACTFMPAGMDGRGGLPDSHLPTFCSLSQSSVNTNCSIAQANDFMSVWAVRGSN